MKNTLTTMMMVLTIAMFANAQFDMQRSRNNGTEPNVIRPEITNQFSGLGAAYTLGTEAGNLTGNYGDYVQFRLYNDTSPSGGRGIRMTLFDADGEMKRVIGDWEEGLTTGPITSYVDIDIIITADKLFGQFCVLGIVDEKIITDIDVFAMLGGYIDYAAISGSGAVEIREFQFGNGWVQDENNYGYTNMQLFHGYNNGFDQPVSFTNGTYNWNNNPYTFSSKALAWNAETGAALSGQFRVGGVLGLQAWNNLTFTFGSFERVPAVPEPGTLVVLGLAAVGLPAVRRLRKG